MKGSTKIIYNPEPPVIVDNNWTANKQNDYFYASFKVLITPVLV